MKKYFKLKRLKIAEQILIVLFCAVMVPMIVSGLIINNINQHAIRAQLRDSAKLVSSMVSEEIDMFIATTYNEHLTSFNGATCKFCAKAAFKGAKCLL